MAFLRFQGAGLVSKEDVVSSSSIPCDTRPMPVPFKVFVSYDCISNRSNIRLNFELAKISQNKYPLIKVTLKVLYNLHPIKGKKVLNDAWTLDIIPGR